MKLFDFIFEQEVVAPAKVQIPLNRPEKDWDWDDYAKNSYNEGGLEGLFNYIVSSRKSVTDKDQLRQDFEGQLALSDNPGNEADEVEEFIYELSSIPENKNKDKSKRSNPVAKNSRNMSGAGAHKSKKDYDRKNYKVDLDKEMSEGGCLGKQIKKGKPKKESFDPQAEQSREEEAYDELISAYDKGGEEALAKACHMSLEKLDREMTEFAMDHSLHMDDDRDEVIHRYIEDLVDNADWKDHGEMDYDRDMEENLDLTDNMLGTPDSYYDEEERREAYEDLKDAMEEVARGWERESIMNGICPNCAGTGYQDAEYPEYDDDGEEIEDSAFECDGYGMYGCDEGEMVGASWVDIVKHDERKAERQKAKDNYPGDEAVIDQIARAVKQMDDPRQMYQYMKADYPFMGVGQRSALIAQGMKKAGLTEGVLQEVELVYRIYKNGEPSAFMSGSRKDIQDDLKILKMHNTDAKWEIKQEPNPHQQKAHDDASLSGHQKEMQEDKLDGYYLAHKAKKLWLDDNPGKTERDYWRAGKGVHDEYGEKAGGKIIKHGGHKEPQVWEDVSLDNDEADVSKMLAKALGEPNKWSEMSAPELYAELESKDSEVADTIKQLAKIVYGVKLEETK